MAICSVLRANNLTSIRAVRQSFSQAAPMAVRIVQFRGAHPGGVYTASSALRALYVESLPPPRVRSVMASISCVDVTLIRAAHLSTAFESFTSDPSLPGLNSTLPKRRTNARRQYTCSRSVSLKPSFRRAECILSNSSMSFQSEPLGDDRRRLAQHVKHVVVALAMKMGADAWLFEKVDGGDCTENDAFVRELDIEVLAEAAGIVVADRLCVAERFHDWVRLHESRRNFVRHSLAPIG
eukprot:6175410-Pleurochrysis_carterae.AAC.2